MRARSGFSLAAALLLVGWVSAPGPAGAADRVPRQWKTMSMLDVDVAPFYWSSSGHGSTCQVQISSFGLGWSSCEVTLYERTDGGRSLGVWIDWMEAEPGSNCESLLSKFCYGVFSNRVVLVRMKPAPFGHSEQERAETDSVFPPDERRRVFRKLAARIELYAVPCRCGGVRVGPALDEPPPLPRSGGGEGELPRADIPPGRGVETPNVLGQDEPGSKGRAYARPSGFPPGIEVTALKFFPSGKNQPPVEDRSYTSRFGNGIQYVGVELDLAYPERRERFDFDMEVAVFKDGDEYADYVVKDRWIEPGWTDSYHSGGYGNLQGDFWRPGSYRVEVSVRGEVVATGEFEVVASP